MSEFLGGSECGCLESVIKALCAGEDAAEEIEAFEQIGTVEKHYVRKENQLFPCLEQHGWDSPSTNMWALHDEIRDKIRALRQSLEAGELGQLQGKSRMMQEQMLHLIAVEEQRLLGWD